MSKVFRGSSEIVVYAESDRVYSILSNSTLLPRWAPMVKSTAGGTEQEGSVRECQVEWEGRKDRVAERCVEAVASRRISWVMEKGTMTKMFSLIRFGFELEPKDGAMVLRMRFLYAPRNLLARLMWHLMMKRKLVSLRTELLGNLKRLAESQ